MVVRFLVPRGSGIKFAQYENCYAWLKLMTEVADQCRFSVRIGITGYGYLIFLVGATTADSATIAG